MVQCMMDELHKLKKSLKQWESDFFKQHSRKPGKNDINAASSDIQECYMKYTKIKQILKETDNQSKTIDNQTNDLTNHKLPSEVPAGDDQLTSQDEELGSSDHGEKVEVWGSQFDRKTTQVKEKEKIPVQKKENNEYLQKLGSKMFQQSLKIKSKCITMCKEKEVAADDGLSPASQTGDNQLVTSGCLQPVRCSQAVVTSCCLKKTVDKADISDDVGCIDVESQPKRAYGLANSTLMRNAADSAVSKPAVKNKDDNFIDSKDLTGDNEDNLLPLDSSVDSSPAYAESHIDKREETDNEPAFFGKLFEKASAIAKPKFQKPVCETRDSFLDKFKSKSKSKQTVLPSNLSSLVSVHREKYGEPDYEADSYDSVDGDASIKGNQRHLSAEADVFDNDFEKEFKKVIEERSTYTEQKCDARNKKPSRNEIKAEHEMKKALEKKEMKVPNEITIDGTDIYELDDKKTEIRSPVKIVRGRRNRISRVKTHTNNSNSKTEVVTNEFEETNCDTHKSEKDRFIGDTDSAYSDDNDDIAINENSRKRKGAKANTAPEKRRKTTTDEGTRIDDGDENSSKAVRKPVQKTKAVSNDNFIRLNMKVKTYKKKGKSMSGPQYKRMMWKQKMQARSKSYGDSCFKCGQSGHWANKCPGNQSAGSGPSKEAVADEDFPSLQEAAMLARGVKIDDQRKKNIVTKDDGDDLSDTENMEDGYHNTSEPDEELRLEAEIVRSKLADPPAPPAIDPLIEIGENDPIPAIPDFVKKGLKKFGFDSFRPGQEEAVMRILCGLSTLVVLSTGGGKSLCYQLPAYLYSQRSKCIALVVSPLVSLMEDQVTGLPQGIRGVCLHTNMTASQRESVLGSVRDGKAQFLLVSPEAIAGGSMSLISSMSSLPPVAFACIDEAHCLSEWSHNFRPSYLRLCKVLQDKLGVRCFLGLTATATLSTASDVSRHIKITDFRQATIRGSPIPDNLYLSVSRDENRDEAIVGLLQGDRFCNLDSIIIYCTRRDQTDRVATLIRTCLNKGVPQEVTTKKNRKKTLKLEWDAESYHAGLTPAQRKRVQNAFMNGRLRVVVATVAFGMGLDKSDVRGIIHYNMPKSFESYVQEIGRAGRDREPAQCHVFLDPEFNNGAPTVSVQYGQGSNDHQKIPWNCVQNGKDLCELRRHTYANTVDYKTLKRLVQKLFPPCRCRDVHEKHADAVKAAREDEGQNEVTMATDDRGRLCPGHERALPIERTVMELDVKEEGISTLMCYLELHSKQWLENLSNVYATCRMQCYGGPSQLQAVAKKCPPVAVAIAKARKDGASFSNSNMIEFPVVEISDAMGWESGPVKKELKLLMWDFSGVGPKRTGVMVEFSELAYHFRSPGDLSVDELDDVLQFLHTRVQRQEKTELSQLSRLYQALKSVSHKNYWMCSDNLDMARNDKLKSVLNEYFDSQTLEESGETSQILEEPVPQYSMDQVISDIRQFHNLYGQEHSLSGRAIARIFHGIASPCFPATTWGRVRRFWRSHLNVDFNQLMKIATKELISLR